MKRRFGIIDGYIKDIKYQIKSISLYEELSMITPLKKSIKYGKKVRILSDQGESFLIKRIFVKGFIHKRFVKEITHASSS